MKRGEGGAGRKTRSALMRRKAQYFSFGEGVPLPERKTSPAAGQEDLPCCGALRAARTGPARTGRALAKERLRGRLLLVKAKSERVLRADEGKAAALAGPEVLRRVVLLGLGASPSEPSMVSSHCSQVPSTSAEKSSRQPRSMVARKGWTAQTGRGNIRETGSPASLLSGCAGPRPAFRQAAAQAAPAGRRSRRWSGRLAVCPDRSGRRHRSSRQSSSPHRKRANRRWDVLIKNTSFPNNEVELFSCRFSSKGTCAKRCRAPAGRPAAAHNQGDPMG